MSHNTNLELGSIDEITRLKSGKLVTFHESDPIDLRVCCRGQTMQRRPTSPHMPHGARIVEIVIVYLDCLIDT